MPKKILVIDDEELLIKSMNRLLEKHGFEVYSAKNGNDAEVMAEEEDFDLIICDIRMPGRDGVETVKAIKNSSKEKKGKKTGVIFITGFADEETELEAMKLKPLAYLMKPFDINELMQVIKRSI